MCKDSASKRIFISISWPQVSPAVLFDLYISPRRGNMINRLTLHVYVCVCVVSFPRQAAECRPGDKLSTMGQESAASSWPPPLQAGFDPK